MIRHTIIVKANHQLKNASVSSFINHLQDGDCVKLTQG